MFPNQGLKKIVKKDPVGMTIVTVPPELVGAVYVYGRIGSGKSVSILTLAQLYHDNPYRKYKIFDVWGGERDEHLFWTLPSDKINYWENMKKLLRLKDPGPKQYKVNLLYPILGKTNKLGKLPKLPDFVQSKPFTIDFHDVTLEDLSLIIGTPSLQAESIWKDSISNLKKKSTIKDLLLQIESNGGMNTILYKNAISPLLKSGLLQDKNCPYNIDIEKEIKDQETISVLCLDFVDKEYRLFIVGYVLDRIKESLSQKKRKIIPIIREASEFFRVNDTTIIHDRYKIFKGKIAMYIKMGRRGMHLMLDVQSPNETRGLVDGQQDLTLLGRLPGEADRTDATAQLYRDNLITKKQIRELASMNPGQFLVCPSGKFTKFQYFMLPRSRFWEPKHGNFYNNVWAKEVDKWSSFSDIVDELKENYKNEHELFLEELKNRKESKKKKKTVKKETDIEDIITIKNEDNIIPDDDFDL